MGERVEEAIERRLDVATEVAEGEERLAREPRRRWIRTVVWLAITAIGYTLLDSSLLVPVCFIVGCCIAAGQNGINAVSATFYPTVMRVTGVGWTQGIGRIGAILSPFIGSAMIAAKWPHAPMFIVVGLPSLVASTLATPSTSTVVAPNVGPSETTG